MFNKYIKSKIQILPKKLDEIYNIYRALFLKKRVIMIYQMAKVGSSAVYKPLKDNPDLVVFHFHSLDLSGEPHVKGGRRLYQIIRNSFIKMIIARKRNIKFVALTRDPVARNLSNYFYALDMFIPAKTIFSGELSSKDYVNIFLKEHCHARPLEWFDKELKRFTGFDVYKRNFDKSAGYLVGEENGNQFFIAKMERLSSLSDALREFLEIEDFAITRKQNKGSDNWYGAIYRQARKDLQLPKEYLDDMYKSKYATFFYDEKELDDFRRVWGH